MSELSPRGRDLFARARASAAPSAAERARLYERIEQALPRPPSSAPPAAPGGGAVVAVVLAVAGALWLARLAMPDTTIPSAASASASASASAGETAEHAARGTNTSTSTNTISGAEAAAVADPDPDPDPVAVPVPDPDPDPDPTRRAPLDTRDELTLLRLAQSARREHRWDAATEALDAHRARFPRGVLANERDVTRALVLCERGDLERGRVLAARFASTAWAPSLDAACETTRDSTEAP